MAGHSGSPRTGMWVRALYDYESDDQTNLSFSQGDVIQVLTQLESGWWDGVIHNQRGWFPSNYCELIADPDSPEMGERLVGGDGETDVETGSEDDTASQDENLGSHSHDSVAASAQLNGAPARDPEEASFWIPQIKDNGTLYYFNTLTRATATDLPLESPPQRARPAPRTSSLAPHSAHRGVMTGAVAGVSERDEDTDYESGTEDAITSQESLARARNSYVSDGASPATSMESLSATSHASRSKSDLGATRTSGVPQQHKASKLSAIPVRFLDRGNAVPLTWDLLLQDIQTSVERFRKAVLDAERDQFVSRAEDISDHVRLILAAGTGTTDNYFGNPSAITSNKALNPRFRDMMSKFAKLVLDSHISAADFPPQDYDSKCLQDADGFMEGVHGFIEVARQQRGEDIPRLFPGFVGDRLAGANWQNNGLVERNAGGSPATKESDGNVAEPNVRLDAQVVAQMDEMKREIVQGIRKLEGQLVVQDKLISPQIHARITEGICNTCLEILGLFRPWMVQMESITLAPLGTQFQTAQLADFAAQKQQVYNLVSSFFMTCQAVGAPLADEWSQERGEPLEERVNRVKIVTRDLEAATSRVNYSIQLLNEAMPPMSAVEKARALAYARQKNASVSSKDTGRSILSDISSAVVSSDSADHAGIYVNSDSKKVQKIFGQVPVATAPSRASVSTRDSRQIPDFLKLDFDGEIVYDDTTNPPTVKGGTLNGLIEQLTRHDTYQTNFRDTFLLTYQSFMNGKELFAMLVNRWSIQAPLGLDEDEYTLWTKEKQDPIRFRILNILKTWVGHYWMEDDGPSSQVLLQKIYNFVQDTMETSSESAVRPLLTIVEQRMKGEDPQAKKLVASVIEGPQPKLPKNMKKFKYSDIDPIEFARQLTITESRLYCQVKPHECLNKLWTVKAPPGSEFEPAPNIKALIRHSNQITNWVADMVLAPAELKKRANVIKYFIAVAEQCLQLSNFSTLTSILAALGHSTIHRLNRTWNAVDKKSKETLQKLDALMSRSKNFTVYREALHQCHPPCIPFVGIYLTDLIFIEEGIPSVIKHSNLINFYKRAKTAEVIREIMNYQNINYPFKTIAEIQSYIADKKEHAGNIHEMYNRSCKIEPREREDEKIARLLSESGFL